MFLAIISDTHDNEATIRLALNYIATLPVVALVHCGDISTPETLMLIAELFPKPIHAVTGNMDFDLNGFSAVTKRFPNVTVYGEDGSTIINGVPVAFSHYPNIAKTIAAKGQHRFVFYGHTHKPWEEKIGTCTVLNPGNLANQFYKPTFALVDLATGKATLKLVEQLVG